MQQAHSSQSRDWQPLEVEEFLYMDPDTGMVQCMVRDGEGFRVASALDEVSAILEGGHASAYWSEVVRRHEQAFQVEPCAREEGPMDWAEPCCAPVV